MSKWISVEEKLPKIGDEIEICFLNILPRGNIKLQEIIVDRHGFHFRDKDGHVETCITGWRAARPIPKYRKVTLEFFKFEDVMPEKNRKIFAKYRGNNDLTVFYSNKCDFWQLSGHEEWAYVPEEMMGDRD